MATAFPGPGAADALTNISGFIRSMAMAARGARRRRRGGGDPALPQSTSSAGRATYARAADARECAARADRCGRQQRTWIWSIRARGSTHCSGARPHQHPDGRAAAARGCSIRCATAPAWCRQDFIAALLAGALHASKCRECCKGIRDHRAHRRAASPGHWQCARPPRSRSSLASDARHQEDLRFRSAAPARCRCPQLFPI